MGLSARLGMVRLGVNFGIKGTYLGSVIQKQSPNPGYLSLSLANAIVAEAVTWCLTKRGYISTDNSFSI